MLRHTLLLLALATVAVDARAGGGFAGDLLSHFDLVAGKLADLGRAIAPDRYSWRPDEGQPSP